MTTSLLEPIFVMEKSREEVNSWYSLERLKCVRVVRWFPEKNDPREDECEVANWCSTACSFLLSLSFLFSFHPLSEIGKNTPIPSTVIFFVETDVVWNKGETSISRPVLALFPSLIWTWTTILITEELPTSNSCGIATVAAMFFTSLLGSTKP